MTHKSTVLFSESETGLWLVSFFFFSLSCQTSHLNSQAALLTDPVMNKSAVNHTLYMFYALLKKNYDCWWQVLNSLSFASSHESFSVCDRNNCTYALHFYFLLKMSCIFLANILHLSSSLILVNFAHNCIKQNKNILFYDYVQNDRIGLFE